MQEIKAKQSLYYTYTNLEGEFQKPDITTVNRDFEANF